MKMWTTIIIVALMLAITSATIFLLPKNNEINEQYNHELPSGDESIFENEKSGDLSGDEINLDKEVVNNYSGESSGEILDDIKSTNSGEKQNIETTVNMNNENKIQKNTVTKVETVEQEHIEVTPFVTQPVQTEVVNQLIQEEQIVEELCNYIASNIVFLP